MASSTLGLALNRAPYPLIKEVLTEESMFVEISTKVQVGGQGNNIQWEKHTTKICKIDHLNKELMMNRIIEFEDACAAGCLNLSNGEKIYSRFRELLGDDTLPYDEGALKIELFKMMLSDWQINLNNTGLDIMDDAYMLQCLVRFMTVQEATFNAVQDRKWSTTTSPAHCSPARPGGGHVTFQQGHHSGRGLPVRAVGRGAGGSAGGNCHFHSGGHNWEMCFANPHGLNYRPGFLPSVPGGAARGGRGNHAGGWGQPRRSQHVHFTENPEEEAKEHGYEEKPMLQSDMGTEAKGHSGEPSQEEQHWLENYNLDDQE
jgi:hypothetical protein